MTTPTVELHETFWPYEGPGAIDHPTVRQTYAAYGDPEMLISAGLGAVKVAAITSYMAGRGLKNFAVCNLTFPNHLEFKQMTGEIVDQSILQGSMAVIHDINSRAGRSPDTPITGVVESAGAKLLLAAHARPAMFTRLIANAPLGVNNADLGATTDERYIELKKRIKAATKRAADLGFAPIKDCLVDEPIDFRHIAKEFRNTARFALDREDGGQVIQDLKSIGLLDHVYVGVMDRVFSAVALESAIPGLVRPIPDQGHPFLMNQQGCDYIMKVIGMDRNLSHQRSHRVVPTQVSVSAGARST